LKLKDFLKSKKIIIGDGAWGTELSKLGLEPGYCPELLNVENPSIVRIVADSYIKSGSEIIISNTFGGNPYKLRRWGLENRIEELNIEGARISVESAKGSAFVAASIGSTGEFLEPLGTITESEMIKEYIRQFSVLSKTGVDGFVLETFTDLSEMLCAIKASREVSDLPVICSMTFDKGLRGYATIMGIEPSKAAEALEAAGADSVGSNCGAGIANMIEVTRLMRPSTGLPLWIKPNAGLPELENGKTVYRESPADMAALVPELISAGANIIGGCCGTTPEHIVKIREKVAELSKG